MNIFTNEQIQKIKNGTLILSVLLFLASFTQVAFYKVSVDSPTEINSLFAFLFGFFVIAGNGFSWLANPFIIISWTLTYKDPKKSLNFSLIAFLLSLSFLLTKKVATNEGGTPTEIISYGIGYWLWLSSCIVNLIGNLILKKISQNHTY